MSGALASKGATATGGWRNLRISRHRGTLIAVAVFAALFLFSDLISPGPISYFEVSYLSSGGATLAIAAVGETFVILSGGFDLSAGAVISLVNVVLASSFAMGQPDAGLLVWTLVGISIGAVTGAFYTAPVAD